MCCMACPFSPAPSKQSKNSITTVSKSEDLLQPEHEKKLHNLYQVQQQLEKLSVHLYMRNLIIGNSIKFNCKHSHFEEQKMVGW